MLEKVTLVVVLFATVVVAIGSYVAGNLRSLDSV